MVAAACLAMAASPAQAQDRRTIDRPGGFVAACAGYLTGSYVAGDNLSRAFGDPADCHSATFAPGHSAATNASYDEAGMTTDGRARASFGTVQVIAQRTGINPGLFPSGAAVGGWSDTWTFVDAARTGQTGQVTFLLDMSGQLKAGGPQGAAQAQLFVAQQGVGGIAWERWAAQSTFVGDEETVNVNEVVGVTATFRFGQAFGLDVYASALATPRSGNTMSLESASMADFYSTLRWGGIQSVTVDGMPLADYQLNAASGMDWRGALLPVPEPASGLLTVIGLLGLRLGAARRRAGAQAAHVNRLTGCCAGS